VAYKHTSNYLGGSNCDFLGSYINWHIVGLIAIGLDHILIGINGGFDGGLFDRFHLAMLGYQPKQSVQQLS
jgi:hypothetical protein